MYSGFVEKPSSPVHAEPSSAVNEDFPPSPPRASINEQLESTQSAGKDKAEKTTEAGNHEVEKPVEVVMDTEKVVTSETAEVESIHPKSPEVAARDAEKGKSAQEDPVTIFPSSAINAEKNSAGDQGASSFDEENDSLRPDETLGDHYYRTYTKRKASEIHTPVWNLKKCDTFSNWRVCHDWLQGTFPPAEIKFQEDRAQEQAYHAYLEEAARYTSTTHRIVREWRSMCKEWAAFEASKKKIAEDEAQVTQMKATLEADRAKFESDLKTEEWSVAGWRRKVEAEAALLSKERKNWREICEKDNKEKIGLRNIINNLKAEEQLKAEVESAKKDLELERTENTETSRRLAETEDKLENSETARATAESEVEPLKSDMLWLKEREIASIADSVLNSEELDKTVAHLLVAAQNDGYAQGYAECSHHVVNALKVDWDTSRFATHGVDTEAALATAKTQFNTLQLPVMDLITIALQSEDYVTQLREVFPDKEEDENEDLA
ncbi:hypothetical protein HanRHA438_Chr11g0501491 [Helianthus annuus]|nr:hypothetical protein HanOQP8_Chr11g0403321 [Helianthus annuus]KAJ0870526.1 hypothetical protein HanRHA438_Chr11g0501491 [Helianthus annuus]